MLPYFPIFVKVETVMKNFAASSKKRLLILTCVLLLACPLTFACGQKASGEGNPENSAKALALRKVLETYFSQKAAEDFLNSGHVLGLGAEPLSETEKAEEASYLNKALEGYASPEFIKTFYAPASGAILSQCAENTFSLLSLTTQEQNDYDEFSGSLEKDKDGKAYFSFTGTVQYNENEQIISLHIDNLDDFPGI